MQLWIAPSDCTIVMNQIPAFQLRPEPLTPEAAGLPPFRSADPEIGTRHRLGGEASFVGTDQYPRCDSCSETMTFYGQLDSVGDDFALADAGVVQVFVCFDCFTSEAVIRSS